VARIYRRQECEQLRLRFADLSKVVIGGRKSRENPRTKEGQNDEQLFLRVMDSHFGDVEGMHIQNFLRCQMDDSQNLVCRCRVFFKICCYRAKRTTNAIANPEEYIRTSDITR
jgi:hypothetical protein